MFTHIKELRLTSFKVNITHQGGSLGILGHSLGLDLQQAEGVNVSGDLGGLVEVAVSEAPHLYQEQPHLPTTTACSNTNIANHNITNMCSCTSITNDIATNNPNRFLNCNIRK